MSRSSWSAMSWLSTRRTVTFADRNQLGGGDASGGGGSVVGAGGFGVSAASRCTVTVPLAAGVFGVNETLAFQWKRSFGATCDVQSTAVAHAFCSAAVGA